MGPGGTAGGGGRSLCWGGNCLCSERQDEAGSISKQITKERTFLVGKLSVFNNSRKEAVENLSVWKLDCLEPAAAQLWLVLECFGAVGTEEK